MSSQSSKTPSESLAVSLHELLSKPSNRDKWGLMVLLRNSLRPEGKVEETSSIPGGSTDDLIKEIDTLAKYHRRNIEEVMQLTLGLLEDEIADGGMVDNDRHTAEYLVDGPPGSSEAGQTAIITDAPSESERPEGDRPTIDYLDGPPGSSEEGQTAYITDAPPSASEIPEKKPKKPEAPEAKAVMTRETPVPEWSPEEFVDNLTPDGLEIAEELIFLAKQDKAELINVERLQEMEGKRQEQGYVSMSLFLSARVHINKNALEKLSEAIESREIRACAKDLSREKIDILRGTIRPQDFTRDNIDQERLDLTISVQKLAHKYGVTDEKMRCLLVMQLAKMDPKEEPSPFSEAVASSSRPPASNDQAPFSSGIPSEPSPWSKSKPEKPPKKDSWFNRRILGSKND